MVERLHNNIDSHISELQEQADFRGYALKPLEDGAFHLVRGPIPMRPAVFGGHVRPSHESEAKDDHPKSTKTRRSRPSRAAGVRGPCGPRMPDFLNPSPRNKE